MADLLQTPEIVRAAEVAKERLYKFVAEKIPLVDDGISAPEDVARAAVKLCHDAVEAAAAWLSTAVRDEGAGAGVRKAAADGSAFAVLVLEHRAARIRQIRNEG